jgi:hypothetical protein
VIDGKADVAPLDSYAFRLLRLYRPDLTDQVRVVDRTVSRPIPPIVGFSSGSSAMGRALVAAGEDPEFAPLLSDLLLTGFTRPAQDSYDVLREDYIATTDFWRRRPIASDIHPAFAS